MSEHGYHTGTETANSVLPTFVLSDPTPTLINLSRRKISVSDGNPSTQMIFSSQSVDIRGGTTKDRVLLLLA
jgi:hypothetical protein